MNIIIVAGARPNFMKIAPIIEAIQKISNKEKVFYHLVHTGQHFDKNMSDDFLEDLGIPRPDINLECGGGSHAEQTACIMIGFEKFLLQNTCDIVLVVGDVNSTLACSIVAKKLNIEVAHIEAGIRSGDFTMPEEINRLVTDSIADYFFTTSETANENLRKAGIQNERIFFVGNTMIDTLLKNMSRFKKPMLWDRLSLKERGYFVITLHRPINVDIESNLQKILNKVSEGANGLPVIFPVHPRTAKFLGETCIDLSNIHIIDPLRYLEFNYLVKHAKAVITDSGGITEETTVMGVPCMTLRNNTERPETVTLGTNELIGTDPNNLMFFFNKLSSGQWKNGNVPPLWDGNSAERIINHLLFIFSKKKIAV